MTEQTRSYFYRMYEEASRFHQAKREREDEKRALMAADDWDAVSAWYEREKQFLNPFTSGQYKAYWAFDRSSEIETGDLEMSDLQDDGTCTEEKEKSCSISGNIGYRHEQYVRAGLLDRDI